MLGHEQTCRVWSGHADVHMLSTMTHKVAKTNKKYVYYNLCSYLLPFFSSCAVDHSGTSFSLHPTLTQQYPPVVAGYEPKLVVTEHVCFVFAPLIVAFHLGIDLKWLATMMCTPIRTPPAVAPSTP